MDFTEGRRRHYERLMKEKPGFTQSCPSERRNDRLGSRQMEQ
ncbi:MAG: hypothetical protein K0Q73_8468 [Paenibacillus sp.]|nr:hypothetical protein [Paenibacillus sp.]